MVMLASFLAAKTMKKREQIMLKNVFFSNIDFQLLFSGLLHFGDDFGRPRALQKSQKVDQHAQKIDLGRVYDTYIFEGGF